MGLKNRIENNTNEIKKVNDKLKVLNGFIRPLLGFSGTITSVDWGDGTTLFINNYETKV